MKVVLEGMKWIRMDEEMVRRLILLVLVCGLVAGCGDGSRHVSCDRYEEDADYEWDAGAEPDGEEDGYEDDGEGGDWEDGGDSDSGDPGTDRAADGGDVNGDDYDDGGETIRGTIRGSDTST